MSEQPQDDLQPPTRQGWIVDAHARILRIRQMTKGIVNTQTILIAIALVVIGWIALTQGFEKALADGDTTRIPVQDSGQKVQAGPLQITIKDARVEADCATGFGQFSTCVTVTADVLNTSPEFIEDRVFGTHLLDAGLAVLYRGQRPAPDLRSPNPVVWQDGRPAGAFQPGIGTEVEMVWHSAPGVSECDFGVALKSAKWGRSPMDLHEHWLKTDPQAIITLCPAAPGQAGAGGSDAK